MNEQERRTLDESEEIRKGFESDSLAMSSLSDAADNISQELTQRFLLSEEIWLILRMPNRFDSLLDRQCPRFKSEIKRTFHVFF
jgi:hypothetical protein